MIKILKVDEDTHKAIRIASAKEGITMKEYVAKLVSDANGVSFNPYDENGNPTEDGYLSVAKLDTADTRHFSISYIPDYDPNFKGGTGGDFNVNINKLKE